MADTLSFLKVIGLLLALPLFIAIPVIGIAKFSTYWFESSIERKNKISLVILVVINVLSISYTAIYNFSIHSQLIALTNVMLATHIHFSAREIRNQGGFKTEGHYSQKHEAFGLGFKGAWHSKCRWGIIYLIACIAYAFFIQLI